MHIAVASFPVIAINKVASVVFHEMTNLRVVECSFQSINQK